MQLKQERGQYGNGDVIRLNGSFRIDGTNSPDVIRDGNSNIILSVVRNSAGNFTVTFDGKFPLPSKITHWHVDISQAAAPTAFVKPHMVIDSWSAVTRSFVIQCIDFSTPSATDPDDNDMIAFELVGCINSAGTDAA